MGPTVRDLTDWLTTEGLLMWDSGECYAGAWKICEMI